MRTFLKQITYKKSGVDIEEAGRFVEAIRPLTRGIGGFGSLFKFDTKNYQEPYLVSSTDGVGTKLKIAFLAGKHDTVGIDLVGMNVNDILCVGAKPLFFLDYIACEQDQAQVERPVRHHPDPDLPDGHRRHQRSRSADLPHHLVGLRSLVAADQRGRPHLDLVRSEE